MAPNNPLPCGALVIGAGAAGMMAAARAAQGGGKVILLDHEREAGRKILISGGGNCNVTNIHADGRPTLHGVERYVSRNPRFARSALSVFTPQDMLDWLKTHSITTVEKEAGQYFCQGTTESGAKLLRDALLHQCHQSGVQVRLGCTLMALEKKQGLWSACWRDNATGQVFESVAPHVVLATGGKAIPKLGATGLALEMAARLGLEVVSPAPALVPLVLPPEAQGTTSSLAGVSLEVCTSLPKGSVAAGVKKAPTFKAGMVFTHKGLSGPAVLQISSYMATPQSAVLVDLLPNDGTVEQTRQRLENIVAARPKASALALMEGLPRRLGQALVQELFDDRPLAAQPRTALLALVERLRRWVVQPSGTEGYTKAEVMRGGVATSELNQRTMEVKTHSGLYIIGEAVDVTGWLGGYNFQWAWASGHAAGSAVASALAKARDPMAPM
ncbi:aminoacetone oxidase family FAD-binding enzyme [Formicincola oecophyllae]|uniref:Aminoacetone oxidase family FAD-binding enzyme n=1 Tax=Formicincola oecophyllae TaxID=2558361 RepID=A0A4Y6U7C2_9PROT|nr:aminoacetone oxidase family FAD-binding enzyme [Formicincola oecophyllae]QDH13212.1 aminoacetone oxidase family FAD-binding enzyme [Formicincola oecophyllae]